jgi:Fe-S-cluster containining protein
MNSESLRMLKEDDVWYKEGLRFKCTGCGQCCTGAPGYTWVSEKEIVEISAHLKLSVKDFSQRYLRYVDGKYSLRENPVNYDCIFLKEKKCQIYLNRPTQCRTYPWWPRVIKSEADWINASHSCEGINHPDAPLVPATTIEEQLNIQETPGA